MKAGVTPKLDSKWWKDNKDLLVPEAPLFGYLKEYEIAKTKLTKDPCIKAYNDLDHAIDQVTDAAKTQIGKCNKLLHKDTIAALQKYPGVTKTEKDVNDDAREKYKTVIKDAVGKARGKADDRIKRLDELAAAVKTRMKKAPVALKDGKGRELGTELASDLTELATRFKDCNVVREEVEKLAAERDYDLVCATELRLLKKDLSAKRDKTKQLLETLSAVIDDLGQKQGQQEGANDQKAIEKFKKDVDDLARRITDRKMDAMLSLGDVGKIRIDNNGALQAVAEQVKVYTQYEQDLVGFIREATDIQRPVALLLKKSEEGQKALKKLKGALSDDAVELKSRCKETLQRLGEMEKQCKTYADWVKRAEQVENEAAKLEQYQSVQVKLFNKMGGFKREDYGNLLTNFGELVKRAEDRTGLNELNQDIKGQIRDMELAKDDLRTKLKDLGLRFDAMVKDGLEKAQALQQKIKELDTPKEKDKRKK